MKKGGFWNTYKIITCIFILLGVILLAYVEKSLLRYEASQPEQVVTKQIQVLKEAALNDELPFVLNMNLLPMEEQEAYVEKLKNAENWTYKILSGSYSETDQSYGVYADDELVAQVYLESESSEVVMAILTVYDWKLSGIKPIYAEAPVPTAAVAENTPTPTEEPTEIVIKKYRYTFVLPEEYMVKYGDEVLSGEKADDGMIKYAFESTDTDPVFCVSDCYGCTVDYPFGDTLTYYDIIVKIPSNFEIHLGDVNVAKYIVKYDENPKYEYCKDFADMPTFITYELPKSLTHPEFNIVDNLGKSIEYAYNGESIEITEQTSLNEVPTEMADTDELLQIAQMWSLFLTKDIYKYDVKTGEYHDNGAEPGDRGLGQIRKVLVADSYLDQVAVKYAKSVDITFISAHTLPNPAFAEEHIGNFVKYSDDFFSCDISFEKIMLRTNGKEFELKGDRDKLNSTCYFLRNKDYDGSEDSTKWLLAELIDNLETEGNQSGED